MTSLTAERGVEPIRRRLYLPAYRIIDAARYAHASPQTVARWRYRDGSPGPALPDRERRRPLSYMELIEVVFVAFFRNAGVPFQRIRKARQYVAQNFNAEYPFVEHRFKSEGLHLLMEFDQFEPGNDFSSLIATDAGGQLAWESLIAEKFAEFDYEILGNQNLALTWHPVGRESLVVIDPRISFGAPNVQGIPTWVVKGRWDAGESIEDILEDFGLSRDGIIDGLKFEGVEEDDIKSAA